MLSGVKSFLDRAAGSLNRSKKSNSRFLMTTSVQRHIERFTRKEVVDLFSLGQDLKLEARNMPTVSPDPQELAQEKLGTSYMDALKKGSIGIAKLLASLLPPINAVSSEGETLAHYFVEENIPDGIHEFVSYGGDLNQRSHTNKTPLDVALNVPNNDELIDALLVGGADPYRLSRTNEVSMMCLASRKIHLLSQSKSKSGSENSMVPEKDAKKRPSPT